MTLRATTRALEADVDLVAFAGDDGVVFEHEGDGIAGRGVALRIELAGGLAGEGAAGQVQQALTSIAWEPPPDASPGAGLVAIGALPFDRSRRAALVVPAVIVRRFAGRAWLTTVHADGEPEPAVDLGGRSRRQPSPDSFALQATVPHNEWRELVVAATKAIADGDVEKVVIAREVTVEANAPIAIAEVVSRLRSLYPSCMVFSIDGFVGASPELLIARTGSAVRSHPLAGTLPRSGDPRADDATAAALLQSAKDRWEHELVVDAVGSALRGVCETISVPDAPTILPLRNVLHLGSEIAGHLRSPAPTALDLVARLHPTPAVGGTPRPAALRHIDAAECFDRGRYAGPVGWVDAHGDGEWAIGIRSAELDGRRARLFAGVGIVEGSDPDAELVETQLKLQALLAAVVRP